MNDQEWQNRLKALRARYPSNRAMADAIGYTEGAVSYWLSGDRVPPEGARDLIIEALERAATQPERDGEIASKARRENDAD